MRARDTFTGAHLDRPTDDGIQPEPLDLSPPAFATWQPAQQRVFHRYVERSNQGRAPPLSPEEVWALLSESDQTTMAAVTHGLANTQLSDREGRDLGSAVQLLEEITAVHGENSRLPSDKQFQLYATLAAGAAEKLNQATQFDRGINSVFHQGFPISFRQPRRSGARGMEAGLHISVSKDGKRAVIHVDYLFGLPHLGPGNSDVRAKGNHRKHLERWPGLQNWWSQRHCMSRYTEAVDVTSPEDRRIVQLAA